MIEAIRFSETSVLTSATWRFIPEEDIFLSYELCSPPQTLVTWVQITLETRMSVCVHSVCVVRCADPPYKGHADYVLQANDID
jgi:hypothetical protein